ncbi:MAG TPA: ParB/RepB/Spo0J family partition protein [Isosphaeraceae bacterium]|jgi:ParB family chromosome partitioning protein|nr:ParB/RepB/Spo0J family partition protein [Isosphaeraceae bacterium]
MSKAHSLKERYGANIAQTVGMRAGATSAQAAPPADRYAGAIKARSFGEMPVDAIVCEAQPRTEFDAAELARLAESIKRFGQLAPIRLRYDEPRGHWVVLVGERRLRACRLAGLERVRVEFVERAMTEADILAEQVVENVVRAELLPVEQGRAYQRLIETNGWTAQQLAETLGIDATAVYRALALLRLPDDVAARVDAGQIKPTAGYEIAKLQTADDQRAVAEMVVGEGLDHSTTVAEVNRRRGSRTKRKGRGSQPAEQRFRGPHGVQVVVRAKPRQTAAEIAADLRSIADRIEAAGADAA